MLSFRQFAQRLFFSGISPILGLSTILLLTNYLSFQEYSLFTAALGLQIVSVTLVAPLTFNAMDMTVSSMSTFAIEGYYFQAAALLILAGLLYLCIPFLGPTALFVFLALMRSQVEAVSIYKGRFQTNKDITIKTLIPLFNFILVVYFQPSTFLDVVKLFFLSQITSTVVIGLYIGFNIHSLSAILNIKVLIGKYLNIYSTFFHTIILVLSSSLIFAAPLYLFSSGVANDIDKFVFSLVIQILMSAASVFSMCILPIVNKTVMNIESSLNCTHKTTSSIHFYVHCLAVLFAVAGSCMLFIVLTWKNVHLAPNYYLSIFILYVIEFSQSFYTAVIFRSKLLKLYKFALISGVGNVVASYYFSDINVVLYLLALNQFLFFYIVGQNYVRRSIGYVC